MKATTLWQPSSGITNTNSSGFTGLPGGYRSNVGAFDIIGYYGFWWSSSENVYPWFRYLNYGSGSVVRDGDDYRDGFSVRCLRD
jgi:uncharacterized protein (TIGR02145 family)